MLKTQLMGFLTANRNLVVSFSNLIRIVITFVHGIAKHKIQYIIILPIISFQFMAYLTSHLYFMAFLTLLCVAPPNNTARQSMVPFWYEITVWVWYLGLLLAQMTNPGRCPY